MMFDHFDYPTQGNDTSHYLDYPTQGKDTSHHQTEKVRDSVCWPRLILVSFGRFSVSLHSGEKGILAKNSSISHYFTSPYPVITRTEMPSPAINQG